MSNSSTIIGSALTASAPSDPELCRISGYLRDLQGYPLKGSGFVVRNVYAPIGRATNVLFLRERLVFRTDATGYVQFDLVRGATVDVELPNRLTDHVMHCLVPDAASVDLIDFLYPYVVSVEFVTPDPVPLNMGDILVVEAQAVLSNGVILPLDGASTTLTQSDESVLLKTSSMVFEPTGLGSCTISVTNFDPASLKLQLQPDGTSVALQAVPSATLPSPLSVTVS